MKRELVLLGIDGSGKSTMSAMAQAYLTAKGYNVKVVPFHKWVIAGFLRDLFGQAIDTGRKDRNAPYSPPPKSFSAIIKPPIAFLDNIFFYWLNKPRKKNDFVIFDRFICATQIKFFTLGYSTDWFKKLWWNFKPKNAIVFVVDIEESIRRQKSRNDPYAYTEQQLKRERELYLGFAGKYNFPVVNTTKSNPEESFKKVQIYLDEILAS
jgi:dTMP kinase